MKIQSEKLAKLIHEQALKLESISKEEWDMKASPQKWSKKEIIGHLIDSAQNNIQRFIRGQYEIEPNVSYDQNQWVTLNNYQKLDVKNLLLLWKSLNEQIVNIWENMDKESMNKKCKVINDEMTIEWLINDYIRHLEHHLDQIKR